MGPGAYPAATTGAGPAAPGSVPPGWYPTPDGRTMWWDGYQWIAAPPPVPAAPYAPVGVSGALAQASMVVIAGILLVTTWAQFHRYQVASSLGVGYTLEQARDVDRASGIVGAFSLIYLVALILAAIAVPIWCNRVHRNLRGALRVAGMEFTPGWAAGWWFVPFANLVMPRRVVAEAWRASDPHQQPGSLGWKARMVPSTLNVWWGLFVAYGVISRISVFSVNNGRVSPDSVQTNAMFGIVAALCGTISAALAVVVFRQLTQRVIARAALFGIREG